MFISSPPWALLAAYLPLVLSSPGPARSGKQFVLEPSGIGSFQDVFQVYQPVPATSGGSCDRDVVLMEHSFGASYGHPFVGKI